MWRPIETAPKDGTRILLYDAQKDIVISGCWYDEPIIDTPNAYEPGWAWWTADEDVIMWDSGPDDAPHYWAPLEGLPNALPR